MANILFQYIKDTRAEMDQVSWPTRRQTLVYTAIIFSFSLFVALYLGIFDYLYTAGLSKGLDFIGQVKAAQQQTTKQQATIPASGSNTIKPEKAINIKK